MFAWVGFGLIFNYTHSVPFGIYREIVDPAGTPRNPAPYVFFCPDVRWPYMKGQPNYRDPMRSCPDGFSPLIKPVVAWPGDTVETSAAGIVVNGQPLPNTATISRDSTGRQLHPFPAGTYRVQKDELWVVSSFSPRSFDSRYFGPIPLRSVHSWIRPFLVEHSYHPANNPN
jgi:conjugative transfer signal peptidase TraF